MIIFLLFATVYALWLYARYQSVWRHIARFPGPVALPLLGNVIQFGTKSEEYFRVIRRWFKHYNYEPFRVYVGPQPNVVISNARSIEAVLSSTSLLHKDDVYCFIRPWLGNGLLTSNGQYWAKHRKMITPSFHFQILQDFHHIINETSDRFMNFLQQYAKTGEIFDFQEVVTLSTLDIMCECAMGYRLNSIEGEKSPIVGAINDMCVVIEERIFSVAKRVDFIFRLTPLYRKQERALKTMLKEFSEIIEARRKVLETHNENEQKVYSEDPDYKRPKMAFLDNLLTARIDGIPLTFQQIFEEVSTFMFEGHDTTASAITFAIYCLSRHPEVQQLAYDEQVEMFGTDVERQPTYQELLDMKYLELVIKETLRMFPSVPVIARTVTATTELDGYVIPPNTTIVMSIIGLGYDEHCFDQPFKFQPERFTPDKREHANPFDNVPFSGGARNCVGQKFAMMELKCTISKMLRHFRILPAVDGLSHGIPNPCEPNDGRHSDYDIRLAATVTLKSLNGVAMRLEKR